MSREIAEFQAAIGQRIKSVRLSAGLSQPEFAEQVGVSQPTVSRVEAGSRMPDAHLLKMIAEKFGYDPTWLLLGKVGKDC